MTGHVARAADRAADHDGYREGRAYGHGGDAPRDPAVGGHRHDHQDQYEGDNGFRREHPPRGNPAAGVVAPRRVIDLA
jgi:hypothetical protein